MKSKVFQTLTYIRQERQGEQYRNTVKDLLLPNTVKQKDEKPQSAGLDDTAIPHIKIQITEIPFEKKLNTVIPYLALLAYRNTPQQGYDYFTCWALDVLKTSGHYPYIY